jgi:nitrogen fixation protein
MSFAHALEFDLYIPPFDFLDEISVAQIQSIGESLKLQTGKRLGFRMSAEDNDIV